MNTYKVEGLRNGYIKYLKKIITINIQAAIDGMMILIDEGYDTIILNTEDDKIAAEIYKDGSYIIY